MGAFIIPDNELYHMANNLESSYGWGLSNETVAKIHQGILYMQIVLGLHNSSLYRKAMAIKEKEFMDEAINVNQEDRHKRIRKVNFWFTLLWITAIVSLFFGVILSLYKPAQFLGGIILLLCLLCILGAIVTAIIKLILKGRAKKDEKTISYYNRKISEFNPMDLMNLCSRIIYLNMQYDFDLSVICDKLGVSTSAMRTNFNKASGGGSTWIGGGSLGLVGLGLGLTAISKLNAAEKNSQFNSRMQVLQSYLFYNNVAEYFNNIEQQLYYNNR
ncbi:MAG: hypothetical protein LBL80_00450 [Ruminococcus sp.]|jgi:hypothetical protein|nr:hypothetical protein [Ruminococcus sp.]